MGLPRDPVGRPPATPQMSCSADLGAPRCLCFHTDFLTQKGLETTCCCGALSHVYTGVRAHLWCTPARVHALTGVCSAHPRMHAVHTVHTHACTLSRARRCTLGQQAPVTCACPAFRHTQGAPVWGTLSAPDAQGPGRTGLPVAPGGHSGPSVGALCLDLCQGG